MVKILFTRIWKLFNHQEHKVSIVGLDNAGKTTILYQFSMNEIVLSNVEEIVINNTCFLMRDVGDQEFLRSSWNTYYKNTEFVIVVGDSTARERIFVTRGLCKILAHEDQRKAGLLIFASIQDVKKCMTITEIYQVLKLTSVKDHQWHIQACCALTGEDLCQGLQ
uniref:ADP-ribosylation factor-like protein 5A n=1 Tax=Callithrix jacchus TaxID=9483 RepID=A0A8I4A6G5_CALJA